MYWERLGIRGGTLEATGGVGTGMYWEELGILVSHTPSLVNSDVRQPPPRHQTSGCPPAPPPRGTRALGNIDRRGGTRNRPRQDRVGTALPAPSCSSAHSHAPVFPELQVFYPQITRKPRFLPAFIFGAKHRFGGYKNPAFPDLRQFLDDVSDGARPPR